MPNVMDAKRDICLLLLVSAYFHYDQVQASLNLDFSNTGRVVSQGTTARLECYSSSSSASAIRAGRIEWSRNSRFSSSTEVIARWSDNDGPEILLNNDGRYSLQGGLNSGGRFRQFLEIRSIKRLDEAATPFGYFCALYNSSRIQIKKSNVLSLTVKYPPAEHYPLCKAVPNAVNEEVTLTCTSEETTPDVTVQWYKDGIQVSDSQPVGYQVQSTYKARADELQSQFECRLVYIDGVNVQVHRSCNFSRPHIAILRMGTDLSTEDRYHAFTHSSPPVVSDIECSLESSVASQHFEREFPGYGVITVGPLAPADNGTDLVCRAKNVLGFSEARMTVYSRDHGSRGEATIPSVTSNYLANEGSLDANIWPQKPQVVLGDNATFVCSYSLIVHSSLPCRASISWQYNDKIVDTTMVGFETYENILRVSNIKEKATIKCIASVYVDETPVINIPSQESSTFIEVADGSGNLCTPKLAHSAQANSQMMTMPVTIGISFLVGVVLLLMIILIIIIFKTSKQHKVLSTDFDNCQNPRVTFRADSNSTINRSSSVGSQAVIQRALPAQPDDASVTTTLRSVVTTPVMNGIMSGTMGKQKPDSISSCNTTTTDLPYQEMVGDTGIVKSRHNSVSNNLHSPLGRSMSTPETMVPGPNGGFMPHNLISFVGHRIAERSMSDSSQPHEQGDGETSYEDPDAMRERRRVRRAMSNDYQQTKGMLMRGQVKQQQNPFFSQYANSSMVDDSVFIPAPV